MHRAEKTESAISGASIVDQAKSIVVERGAAINTLGMGAAPYDARQGYRFGSAGGNNSILAISNGWLDFGNGLGAQSGRIELGACPATACAGTTQLYSDGTVVFGSNNLELHDALRYGTRNLVVAASSLNAGGDGPCPLAAVGRVLGNRREGYTGLAGVGHDLRVARDGVHGSGQSHVLQPLAGVLQREPAPLGQIGDHRVHPGRAHAGELARPARGDGQVGHAGDVRVQRPAGAVALDGRGAALERADHREGGEVDALGAHPAVGESPDAVVVAAG